MNTFTAWAADTGVRAVKTAAQTAVAAVTAEQVGLFAVDWSTVGQLAGLAGAVSILHNLATLRTGGPNGPDVPDVTAAPVPALGWTPVPQPADLAPSGELAQLEPTPAPDPALEPAPEPAPEPAAPAAPEPAPEPAPANQGE